MANFKCNGSFRSLQLHINQFLSFCQKKLVSSSLVPHILKISKIAAICIQLETVHIFVLWKWISINLPSQWFIIIMNDLYQPLLGCIKKPISLCSLHVFYLTTKTIANLIRDAQVLDITSSNITFWYTPKSVPILRVAKKELVFTILWIS